MPTSQTNQIRSLYLTFPNTDSALSIAQKLVDERLVACVNVLPRATSVYRWESNAVTEEEVVAFAKTTADRVAAVVSRVEELHPYDVPEIVTLAPEAVWPAYAQWAVDETRPEG